MTQLQLHSHKYDDTVRNIMRVIAKQESAPYTKIKKSIAEQNNKHLMNVFWKTVKLTCRQQSFTQVKYCGECDKYDLE